jgi:pyrroline-5-carboxylate reductase
MALSGIGIIGCGAMGSALLRGIAVSRGTPAADILVYDLNKKRAESAAGPVGAGVAADTGEMLQRCRCIFLAVKPQDAAAVVEPWGKTFQPRDHLLISLVAGVTIKFYERLLPGGSKIIRLMPNTPCLIREGAVALSAGSAVSAEDLAGVRLLLGGLGLTMVVPEKLMDAVTALSGSGPAYLYLFAEALIDGGVNAGLDRETASALALQTILGAARMLKECDRSPAELRHDVTSPAGTTAAALAVLEKRSFRGSIIDAVAAAAERAGELNRE